MKEKKKNLNISLPRHEAESFLEDLEFLKKHTRTNKSWVVREAIMRYAKKVREAII